MTRVGELHIKLTVRCMGCGEVIEKPSHADIDLFRNGVRVHNKDECVEQAAAKMKVVV